VRTGRIESKGSNRFQFPTKEVPLCGFRPTLQLAPPEQSVYCIAPRRQFIGESEVAFYAFLLQGDK
jgi:hypothetical protein